MNGISNWFKQLDFSLILTTALKIAAVLVLCYLAIALSRRLIHRLLSKKGGGRLGTVAVISKSFFRYLFWLGISRRCGKWL